MRSLSPKTLRELRRTLDLMDCAYARREDVDRLKDELDRVLTPKRSKPPAAKRRAEKKRTRREETRRIRAVVFDRADGLCEVCGSEATDLEHVFGRVRVKQSIRNCIAICRECHRDRTSGRPSHSHWWAAYREVLLRHGLTEEARLCEVKLDHARNLEAPLPFPPTSDTRQP